MLHSLTHVFVNLKNVTKAFTLFVIWKHALLSLKFTWENKQNRYLGWTYETYKVNKESKWQSLALAGDLCNHSDHSVYGLATLTLTLTLTREVFGVHNISVKPDLRLKLYSVVIIISLI